MSAASRLDKSMSNETKANNNHQTNMNHYDRKWSFRDQFYYYIGMLRSSQNSNNKTAGKKSVRRCIRCLALQPSSIDFISISGDHAHTPPLHTQRTTTKASHRMQIN